MRKPRSDVYGEMRRRTEPSKLLSNEPQASCSNSRSGKFPRRLLFLAIPAPLLISLPLSSLCSFYNERATNETYTYTYIYACTVLLYLCDTAIYLLCMRALSSGVFSIFFAIVSSSSPAFLCPLFLECASVSGFLPFVRCESRSLTCPGSRMTGYVRRCVNERGREGQGGKTGYRFSFLSVGNFEIALRRALARLRTVGERLREGCTG